MSRPVLQDLADILQNNSIGTLGVNIFVSKEPETPDSCVTLYVFGGLPDQCLNSTNTEQYNFQVRVRSKKNDYLDGYTLMDSIRALFEKQTYTLTDSLYSTDYRIYALGLPIDLQRDTKQRPIVVMDFGCIRTTEPVGN